MLDHSLRHHHGVFFQADEQPARAQLDLFAREAARLLPGNPPLHFATWDDAFRFIGDQASAEPLVVVLDEFQSLWQSEPHLDSILQRHWDQWDRAGTPVTVVLSGSALTMMERLLDHSSPLYGRAQFRPVLEPLDYRRAAEFAAATLTAEEKILRYAVLGGTPQYQVWAGTGTLPDIIAGRILAKDESLYEEPMHLLRAEQHIRDPGTYFAVVAAIASGATRPSEIANRTGLEVPNLTKMLTRLIDLGYVELRTPIAPRREAKRSSYRVRDPYFRFWFRFVFPNRSLLARGRVKEVAAEIDRDLPTFVGPLFEDCCREWIGRYAAPGRVPRCDELGRWWSRNGQVEIDIVGLDGSGYALIGSCKWSRQIPANVLGQLRAQQEQLGPPAAAARLVIFARGYSKRLRERADEAGVALVTADELF